MAHWFHRNSLKNTVPVKFDELKRASCGGDSNKIVGELKVTRARYVTLVSNHTSQADEVKEAALNYLSLLAGLVTPPAEAAASSESKLRTLTTFKWTNSMGGKLPSIQADAQFEIISVLVNLALWFTKHAARVSANESISMEEAKEVHSSLKLSAGIFQCAREQQAQLPAQIEKATDLDVRVIESYLIQCQAEAQEITLARALELGHKPGIVLALAMDTHKMFENAAHSLETLDKLLVGKWRSYLSLKALFYQSYGYCFWGQQLLTEDKCGDAIAVLTLSKSLYDKSGKLCKEYASAQGPGQAARPDRHPFYQKLGPMIIRFLEKANHENGFIYHHKVPEAALPPEYQDTFGLAKPEDFSIPDMSELWTPQAYSNFKSAIPSASKGATPSSAPKGASPSEEIVPVAEPDIAPQFPQVPKTQSGCIIS
eukprot:TRINITY_DN4320_c0_g1_i2.p1 TRINITY_DN4320_c0_g1~~TRINITY_DN4320_c0_g1_i2.p1  ORF type:complete len:448 (-),score=112.50 TRINITY_DN4320_c0_g1_i2:38-1318(-)